MLDGRIKRAYNLTTVGARSHAGEIETMSKRIAPFAFTASNGYTVEICEYESASVRAPDGQRVGGFSGPSRVWAAHHDCHRWSNWAGEHASFRQRGTKLNVGSAKGEHADAVVAAVREQMAHHPAFGGRA